MWRTDPLLVVILWFTALFAGILVWLPPVPGRNPGPSTSGLAADRRPGSAVTTGR
jgi:hypothetical protein